MCLSGKKILFIDDTVAIRNFVGISLQALGVQFYQAGTATLGLDICQDSLPDLVVLDLGLPDKDGLDIVADIKNTHNCATPPKIIILSVRKETQTKDKAFALGADAYVTKPFLMDDLLEVIQQQLTTAVAAAV